jgi:peptidoglycan/xylan/chitin deacetylase (PgdA/CDA1 family)
LRGITQPPQAQTTSRPVSLHLSGRSLPHWHALWRWLTGNRLRILMYHSISDDPADPLAVPPHLFERQMARLVERGFQVVSLDEGLRRMQTKVSLRRTVVLTFDDGYRDFLENAVPVLLRYCLPATLFVIPGKAGDKAEWHSYSRGRPLLTLEEIQQVKSLGISLGSHTMTHPDLTSLDEARLEYELREPLRWLAEWGETFLAFAYPGGRFTRRERDTVAQAGYACAVKSGSLLGNEPKTDPFQLRREKVTADR